MENETGQEAQTEAQTQEGTSRTVDSMLDEIKELREENKTRRLKERELETQLESTKSQYEEAVSKVTGFEEQLSKFADYDTIKEANQKLEQELRNARIEAQLKGEVTDVRAAMKLLDEEDVQGHQIDISKFIEKNPFLAPQKTNVTNPASNRGMSKSPNSTEDLTKLSPADLEKFFSEYKPAN